MNFEELAREILLRVRLDWETEDPYSYEPMLEHMIKALKSAYSAGYKDGQEESAKLEEAYHEGTKKFHW